jgi:hypothetical protein
MLGLASASEYTATVFTPRRRAEAATRQAISPRLAIRILSNILLPWAGRAPAVGSQPAHHRAQEPEQHNNQHHRNTTRVSASATANHSG